MLFIKHTHSHSGAHSCPSQLRLSCACVATDTKNPSRTLPVNNPSDRRPSVLAVCVCVCVQDIELINYRVLRSNWSQTHPKHAHTSTKRSRDCSHFTTSESVANNIHTNTQRAPHRKRSSTINVYNWARHLAWISLRIISNQNWRRIRRRRRQLSECDGRSTPMDIRHRDSGETETYRWPDFVFVWEHCQEPGRIAESGEIDINNLLDEAPIDTYSLHEHTHTLTIYVYL